MSEAIEVQSISVNLAQPFIDLLALFQVKEKIDSLIDKVAINLPPEARKTITNLIETLNTTTSGSSPLRNIIQNFEEILKDGKIDTTDIPIIVKTITDILNIKISTDNISISLDDASIFVKIIIQGLCDLEVIKDDPKLISKIIDSSFALLNTTLTVGKIATSVEVKKLFCCC